MLLNLYGHTDPMKEFISKIRKQLDPVYGSGEAEWLVRSIMEDVCGITRTDMLLKDIKIPDEKKREAEKVVGRLLKKEPLQYILGSVMFCGIKISVSPAVLIPRPETAELVRHIVAQETGKSPLRILDLCTGSGCIAVALAKTIKGAELFAAEISPEAISVARNNAAENGADIKFVECDVLGDISGLPAKTDIIVSNPPYVTESEKKEMEANVLNYEPHRALFVPDDDPLLFYRRIADIGLSLLNPQGRLYLEINSSYWRETAEMLQQKGYTAITVKKDSYNKERFIACTLTQKITDK